MNDRRTATGVHLIWASVLVVGMGGIGLGLVVWKVVTGAEDFGSGLAKVAVKASSKFKTGQISETFRAEIPVFNAAGVGRLEIGTVDSVETFTRADEKRIFWDLISLGDTEAEIKVPVTYRYHLDLDRADAWAMEVADGHCIVYAPAIAPSLPVAIHTDRLEQKTSEGWARFNEHEVAAALLCSITPTLEAAASSPDSIASIREEVRLAVALFIRAWLVRENQWGQAAISRVSVLFPDESGGRGPSGAPSVIFETLP